MTSDFVLASTIAVSIASITKAPVLSPMTHQTVAVSLTGECHGACSVCKGFKTQRVFRKRLGGK